MFIIFIFPFFLVSNAKRSIMKTKLPNHALLLSAYVHSARTHMQLSFIYRHTHTKKEAVRCQRVILAENQSRKSIFTVSAKERQRFVYILTRRVLNLHLRCCIRVLYIIQHELMKLKIKWLHFRFSTNLNLW